MANQVRSTSAVGDLLFFGDGTAERSKSSLHFGMGDRDESAISANDSFLSDEAATANGNKRVNVRCRCRCRPPSRAHLVHSYTNFLQRNRYWVLFGLLLLVVAAGVTAPSLISKVSNQFHAPPQSQSARNQARVETIFPRLDLETVLVAYIQAAPGQRTVLSQAVKEFTLRLNETLATDPRTAPKLMNFQSYYTFLEAGLPAAYGNAFLSDGPDGTHPSTVIEIVANAWVTSEESMKFGRAATEIVNKLKADIGVEVSPVEAQTSSQLGTVTLLGVPVFLESIMGALIHDLAIMDGIAMPLAVAVLCYVIRTMRLMVIPGLGIMTSTLCSFAIMSFVADIMNVMTFCPSLMMSILVALNVDYSLFITSCFRNDLIEQLNRAGITRRVPGCSAQVDVRAAVEKTIYSAGHTIMVSGLTLAFGLLGLLLFKVEFLQALGVGCCIAVLFAQFVAMTQTVTLMLAFPRFFARCIEPWHLCGARPLRMCRSIGRGRAKAVPAHTSDSAVTVSSTTATAATMSGGDSSTSVTKAASPPTGRSQAPLLAVVEEGDHESRSNHGSQLKASSSGDVQQQQQPFSAAGLIAMKRTVWYKVGAVIVKFPCNLLLLIAIFGLAAPFAMHAMHYPTTNSLTFDLPRTAPTTLGFEAMGRDFGMGYLEPYKIVMVPFEGTAMLSDEFFHSSQAVVYDLVTQMPRLGFKNIAGLVYVGSENMNISLGLVMACELNDNPLYETSFCTGVRQLVNMVTNKEKTATYIDIALGWDPIADGGHKWLQQLRSLLPKLQQKYHVELILTGVTFDMLDAIDWVYAEFPTEILVTTAFILLFVGLSFRSILVPVRAVLTIGLTIAFVFGLATLTYVHGIFAWIPLPAFQKVGAVLWIVPILAFSLCVGIGLDYDIFLLVAIEEARRIKRLDHKSAIVVGMCETGSVITSAGIIMAIGFGGLLFSEIPALNFVSLFLVTAVLFDTFVVRSLVAPAILALFGDANWWPNRPREALKSVL